MPVNSGKNSADIHDSPRQDPRLPPGQVLTDKWPVLQYGAVPSIDLTTWDLKIWGRVTQPMRWTWEEFQKLPRVQVRSDIHCVTRWSRYDNLWEGVAIRELFRHVTLESDARFAMVHADGDPDYTTNLPLQELLQDDVLLADIHDGKALTPEHGWPLRLVVPRRYFWKSAKWVRGFEVLTRDAAGFWERNGYHNDADPWREERFSEW